MYELTSVTQGGNTAESYTFDPVGNRLSSLGVAPYTYNASNQLTSQPGVTYTYDANGNLATKTDSSGTTRYYWDFENRLMGVTPPGGAQVNFKYDPRGRRIQKSSSSGTVNYVYDGANILEEVDTAGNLVTRYTQGLGVDKPLAMLKSGTTSYYEADGLGSVTSLSTSSGALAGTYTYDSFGKIIGSSGTITNPYRFTGRESDSETGLYYYRARYYDPHIGRFISEDPLRFQAGVNFYAYVDNNPINLTDPLGLCATPERVNCSLPALPAGIGSNRVQKMVKETNDFFTVMSNPALGNPAGATPALLGFLTGRFIPRGEWDYKSQYNPKLDPVNYEKARVFGNFAFGAVMQSLNFSYYETQNAAGIAQIGIKTLGGAAGIGYPFFRYPFGDQVGDAEIIKRGWAYQRDCPQ